MSIHVLFFGSVADKLGQRECSLPVCEAMTLSDVVSAVGCECFKPLLLAVNQSQVNDASTQVNAGDEVAMMPPFSGG